MAETVLIVIGEKKQYASAVSPERLFFVYSVTAPPDGLHHRPERKVLRGSGELYRRWVTAARTYEAVLVEEETRLDRLSRLRWTDLLSGGRQRVARARQCYRERTDAAAAAYRPVQEEIEERLAARGAEIEARERKRRIAATERRERADRFRSVADKAVWGWILLAKRKTPIVVVFRHDIAPARALPRGDRRSAEPLDAAGLEESLLGLRTVRIMIVRWESAAREAVADECSVPGASPEQFGHWWQTVTAQSWPNPARIPERSGRRGRPSPVGWDDDSG
ncbi:hypothetical protein [Nocardiopsis ansamitocini]|uniref:Uncharacterized protein n=1 Tax=Nocardiopsis ansamitocini TaxID=1670832 RepID=A0A9W6UH75_9ACTN|nr:hypothetical protein [Nocardiopsis ansamitocini]GLU45680.1 hypothetical protein Nans01_00310 [Nocardiopsis ansamitocini]